MYERSFRIRYWLAVAMCCAVVPLAGDPVMAQPPADKAIAFTQHDPQLKWGPCAPVFPKGCEVAILHGDPAKNHADAFLRVPANYAIPPHWHTSPEHMVLVSGELQVTYKGQQPATLKPGSYAYGPAKQPHKGHCTSGPCVLFIAFEVPVDAEAFTGSLD